MECGHPNSHLDSTGRTSHAGISAIGQALKTAMRTHRLEVHTISHASPASVTLLPASPFISSNRLHSQLMPLPPLYSELRSLKPFGGQLHHREWRDEDDNGRDRKYTALVTTLRNPGPSKFRNTPGAPLVNPEPPRGLRLVRGTTENSDKTELQKVQPSPSSTVAHTRTHTHMHTHTNTHQSSREFVHMQTGTQTFVHSITKKHQPQQLVIHQSPSSQITEKLSTLWASPAQ